MCEKLLKDFDLIPKSESKDSTFFEICGIDNECEASIVKKI